MKKARFIVVILVIISIVIVFSKNIKSYSQEEYPYLNENICKFLENKGNRLEVYAAGIKLNQGSSENTCVYFIAEVLRRNNFNVPKETANTDQFLSLLRGKGFKKQMNYKDLMPGDICFTTDASGNKDGIPTHTYIFMKWLKEGNYDYAYICDNQAKDYNGKIYHLRNIKVIARVNGFDKDAFAFFMKKI